MNNFMDYFFGPLPKEYCLYYYYLTIFSAIIFMLTFFSFSMVLMKSKKIKSNTLLSMFNVLTSLFIGYFTSRLLYTMCVKSL
jgi:hypothetical protein